MLEKSHIYDEIDRYLRGEMSTEESNAFEKELATNQELRARLHIVDDVKEGLHRRAEKLEKIQSWKETEVKGQSKRPRRVLLGTLSVAAAVIAVITLSFPRSGGVMAQEEFQPSMTISMRAGIDFNVDAYWDEGRYEECLVAISEKLTQYQEEMNSLDASQYEEDEYQYNLSLYTLVIDDLSWAKIMTMYKMGQYEDALLHVTDYLKSNGYYQEDAERLYSYLNVR